MSHIRKLIGYVINDDQTWEIYKRFAKKILSNVNNGDKKKNIAEAQMFLFMVGRGYSAIHYSIRPWYDAPSNFNMTKRAEKFLIEIKKYEKSDVHIATLLNKLHSCFKIKNKNHPSFLSKTVHILYPTKCPIYDSRAAYTLGHISKYFSSEYPQTVRGWKTCKWEEYVDGTRFILRKMKKIDHRISDFHKLDKILWYYGTKENIKKLTKALTAIKR